MLSDLTKDVLSTLTPEQAARRIIDAADKAYPDNVVIMDIVAEEGDFYPEYRVEVNGRVFTYAPTNAERLAQGFKMGFAFVGWIVCSNHQLYYDAVSEQDEPIVRAQYERTIKKLEADA